MGGRCHTCSQAKPCLYPGMQPVQSLFTRLWRFYTIVPHLSRIRLRVNSLERVKIKSSVAQVKVSGVKFSQCILLFLCRML